ATEEPRLLEQRGVYQMGDGWHRAEDLGGAGAIGEVDRDQLDAAEPVGTTSRDGDDVPVRPAHEVSRGGVANQAGRSGDEDRAGGQIPSPAECRASRAASPLLAPPRGSARSSSPTRRARGPSPRVPRAARPVDRPERPAIPQATRDGGPA